jgi:transposase
MRASLFWLTDVQWAKIEPRLPSDVRGKESVDDRRVISGILHVLKSGCRWCDCPPEYGPHTTIYNRFSCWAKRGIWERMFNDLAARGRSNETQMIDSTHSKAHRSASSLMLSDGAAHDCPAAKPLIERKKAAKKLLGTRHITVLTSDNGGSNVAPGQSFPTGPNRKQPFSFSKRLYRERHHIENAFCKIKDFRRVFTRYDKLARNFLASVCLAATVAWWT